MSALVVTFFYDLGSPECYLVAERINGSLPVVPEWEPVLGAEFPTVSVDRDSLSGRAVNLGLAPIRWPRAWPPDTREAMLAATYAKRIGRAVAFSLAAFRQAFAGGRDLSDQDTVLIAGAACEMHPTAILKALGLRSTILELSQAGIRARAAGVAALPAIRVGSGAASVVLSGEDSVERAADALSK